MPKVSVIIPVYNVEKYLNEALESIKRQTLKDIEIICVNDGSTDGSLDIIREYAQDDPRFIVLDQENGGYGKAMNAGLDRASGEYVGILEPDDFVPLNMYEDLYALAVQNDLDMIKADFYRFSRDKETGNMSLTYTRLDRTRKNYNTVFDAGLMPDALRFVMNTWSGIYRRDFLEEHHIRHNETPGASFQDNGFAFQTFIYAKRAMITDRPYYMNRRDNPDSSVKSSSKVYCSNIEYDFIRALLMKDPGIWERFKYHYTLKRYHNCIFTLSRIGDGFKREYIETISREFKLADEAGEISKEVFGKKEWKKIRLLISDPEKFYRNNYLEPEKIRQMEKRINDIESSSTFKAGKIIMYIPIAIKKSIKKAGR